MSSKERGDGARWNILNNTYSLLGDSSRKKRRNTHNSIYVCLLGQFKELQANWLSLLSFIIQFRNITILWFKTRYQWWWTDTTGWTICYQ